MSFRVENRTANPDEEIIELAWEIATHDSLAKVLEWGTRQPAGEVARSIVTDVVVQDEYTHDAVVPWKDGLFIVYGIT